MEKKLEANSIIVDTKEMRKRSLMSGAAIDKIKRALVTHENEVGPG